MGLFDFLKPKPRRNRPMDPDFDELIQHGSEPRFDHYTFAHAALRQFAFDDPLQVIAILASDDSQNFVAHILELVHDQANQQGHAPTVHADDINVTCMRVLDYPCAMIHMPSPKAVSEAHFVAILLLTSPDADHESTEVEIAYFTLEFGHSIDDIPRTVFCSWSKNGTHSNMGDGPEPTVEAFAETITSSLKRRPRR